MAAADLVQLLGKTDNLQEPMPLLNRRPVVLAMVLSFLIIAWICGLYRLYVRYFILNCPGWDDFFVILSMASSLLLSFATCNAIKHGLGTHFILHGLDDMQSFIRAFYVCNGAYPMAAAFIKLALLFQYLRMFEYGSKSRRITNFFIVVTALWGFIYTLLTWVPCYPITAFWNLFAKADARWAYGSRDPDVFARSFESHVSINMCLDLIVFFIPLPEFLRAGQEKSSRLNLLILFMLGILINVLSIFRLIGIAETRAGSYPTLDPSWYGCTPIVLATVEINLATICASLPVFWPTLQKNLGQIFIVKEVEVTSEAYRLSNYQNPSIAMAHLTGLTPQNSRRPLGAQTNMKMDV